MESKPEDIRPKFGKRSLENADDVYQHNAWDNVEWDEDFKAEVMVKIEANSNNKVADERAKELEDNAGGYWDKFYEKHENKFFKDRHWLFTEFEELLPEKDSKDLEKDTENGKDDGKDDTGAGSEDKDKKDGDSGEKSSKTIWEIGCGVGNTVFPLLTIDNSSKIFIYCCDFSEKAISIVKGHDLYDPSRCHAFQFDLTTPEWSLPFPENSLSIVTSIFVLSAINPDAHQRVIDNIVRYLKPGGKLLFRDYGHLDLTQVRFKPGQCISDNFYVRGDGTRSFFFTPETIDGMMVTSGLQKLDLHTDRRLQVNRANKKKMYRVWIQAKYIKPA